VADVWQKGVSWPAVPWSAAAGMSPSPERPGPQMPPTAGSRREPAAIEGAPPFASTADDATLVAACVGGHPQAFDLIVERHRRAIYQVCYRFTGNHEDASDLTQDAFVRAYRALPRFKGEAALGTWLYRIAVNVALNHASSRRPPPEPLESTDPPDVVTERPDAPVFRAERARVVRAAIARLPRKQRATLVLRVYHELPHEEIARLLGSSVGAVKANFFHALGNLRRLLGAEPLR
jgi:RNA polymerase sigma-70 factor (ECF subfamily)